MNLFRSNRIRRTRIPSFPPMSTRIKSLWVNALESDDYLQGQSFLAKMSHQDFLQSPGRKPIVRYCCLGILCELAVVEGVISKSLNNDGTFYYGFETRILPHAVANWAALSRDPVVYYANNYITLASLNDSGLAFKKIARQIRINL